MDVRKTFLKLTSRTYPYGYEEDLAKFLPKGYQVDKHGNYFFQIGSIKDSDTIFACHLDTACKAQVDVVHFMDSKYIRTDGKSILGADDKAGMTILLFLIYKNIPGLYYFFHGEEVGCIGSKAASEDKEIFSGYNKIISFDRKDTSSIITHQSSRRCCSDDFADSLISEYAKQGLKMKKDDSGVYTDSAEFTEILPECTNISVGYYREHTHQEYQDIQFLEKIAIASSLVNWNNLSIKRDPSKVEWLSYGNKSRFYEDYGYCTGSPYYAAFQDRRSGRWHQEKKKKTFVHPFQTSNKNSKHYLNNLDNEIERISDGSFKTKEGGTILIPEEYRYNNESHKTKYYEGMKHSLLNDNLSARDLSIIEDQCLDLNDKNDADFLRYLKTVSLIGSY